MARPPSLLTVEEAAQLLRIGRTKAYAMAKQWRQTGGQCGLPVLDLGDVLRVSLARLEELTGAEFSDGSDTPVEPSESHSSEATTATPDEDLRVVESPQDHLAKPLRRRRKPPSDQLDLFETGDPSE